ncbi:MAG: hypothetical protein ACRDPW_01565, partial [Mycobacteriales bacterium]
MAVFLAPLVPLIAGTAGRLALTRVLQSGATRAVGAGARSALTRGAELSRGAAGKLFGEEVGQGAKQLYKSGNAAGDEPGAEPVQDTQPQGPGLVGQVIRTVGGAAVGAGVGFMVGGPAGAAIGGVVGGGLGYSSGGDGGGHGHGGGVGTHLAAAGGGAVAGYAISEALDGPDAPPQVATSTLMEAVPPAAGPEAVTPDAGVPELAPPADPDVGTVAPAPAAEPELISVSNPEPELGGTMTG